MNIDLYNDLINDIKESKFVQNFVKELEDYLETNNKNNSNTLEIKNEWNNLLSEDLEINNKKIINKFRDKMLVERNNILKDYANSTKDLGKMYYIYNKSSNGNEEYNLCLCGEENNNQVIIKEINQLPEGSNLGSVLRIKDNQFVLDKEATEIVEKKINLMLKEKIMEQDKYLESKRVEGHIYEAGEKYSGRIWLYDVTNETDNGIEGIEEIEFPTDLYEGANEGDLYTYTNGKYERYMHE